MTSKRFLQEFEKQFRIRVNKDDIIKEWILCYKPITGTQKLIEELKNKSLKIYFLSDNIKERSSILQKKYNYLKDFDSGIFSHEVGITKKDEDTIFKLALRMTKNMPDEVIFIDDKEEYVRTACMLGTNGIHFSNPKQLSRDIKKLILRNKNDNK